MMKVIYAALAALVALPICASDETPGLPHEGLPDGLTIKVEKVDPPARPIRGRDGGNDARGSGLPRPEVYVFKHTREVNGQEVTSLKPATWLRLLRDYELPEGGHDIANDGAIVFDTDEGVRFEVQFDTYTYPTVTGDTVVVTGVIYRDGDRVSAVPEPIYIRDVQVRGEERRTR